MLPTSTGPRPAPRTTAKLVGASALSVSLLVGPHAAASDPDPWWGRDKALHFGASATIAAGGYGVGTLIFDGRAEAALFGGGIAIGVGAAKEGADAMGLGTPSFKDFTWDVIGAAFGVAVGLGIDLLVASLKSSP